MTLDKLYSPEEVLQTFPEGRRPSLRRLIAKAKEAGGWKKLAVVDQSYGHLEQTAVHDVMRELSRKKT